ncbi:MAG: nucleotide pyrophosphohydrolase [Candidatus Woesearchaeota archaeon]
MDNDTNLEVLKDKVQKFSEDRDWSQFHSPKELAIGIITESSELLEHFRFKSDKEMEEILKDEKKRAEIGEELADIMFFILRFSQMYNFNLSQEITNKIQKNEIRLPIEKSKGLNKKYTEYS